MEFVKYIEPLIEHIISKRLGYESPTCIDTNFLRDLDAVIEDIQSGQLYKSLCSDMSKIVAVPDKNGSYSESRYLKWKSCTRYMLRNYKWSDILTTILYTAELIIQDDLDGYLFYEKLYTNALIDKINSDRELLIWLRTNGEWEGFMRYIRKIRYQEDFNDGLILILTAVSAVAIGAVAYKLYTSVTN